MLVYNYIRRVAVVFEKSRFFLEHPVHLSKSVITSIALQYLIISLTLVIRNRMFLSHWTNMHKIPILSTIFTCFCLFLKTSPFILYYTYISFFLTMINLDAVKKVTWAISINFLWQVDRSVLIYMQLSVRQGQLQFLATSSNTRPSCNAINQTVNRKII